MWKGNLKESDAKVNKSHEIRYNKNSLYYKEEIIMIMPNDFLKIHEEQSFKAATIKRSRKLASEKNYTTTQKLPTMSATNDTSEMDSSAVEVTQSQLDNQMDIDKDDVQGDLKRRKTGKEAMEIVSTPLSPDGQNVLLEKSGHPALTPTNQQITSSDAGTMIFCDSQKTAEFLLNLHTFPQPQTISIKFSSDNPYLAQQQTQNSHVDTQLIAGNIDASVETQNWKKDSRTAIENVDQTTTEIRPTPKDNCFVDHEVPHLNKQNLVKDDNMIMEVDSNVTTSEQKMGDQQKYIHNNPYTALVDENVLQDDNYNSIRGTDNNNDYVPEIEEETNRNIASKEGNKIETESNITIEGDEVTEQRETRQMSYSEALGGHNGKRREVTQRLDNGWSEEGSNIYQTKKKDSNGLPEKYRDERNKSSPRGKLVPLPDTPELIPEMFQNLLPFKLPIKDRKETGQIVRAMRQVFTFTQLPEEYFANQLIPLPEKPEELEDEWRNLFPISNPKELRNIREHLTELRTRYTFKWLLDSYFDLPERKPPLPSTPQMLNTEIAYAFPFTPKDRSDFIRHLDLLREYYEFKKIPNDYIKHKEHLPQHPSDIKLRKKKETPTTLGLQTGERSDDKHTNNHPWATKRQGRDGSNGKERIPDDLNLIKEKISQLEGTENNVTIPITEYNKVTETIKILKESFDFTNIPTHILQLPELEKPDWDLFAYEYDESN
ncbi:hypothetical protein C2G38_2172332 [Gigaspora rosea]|uniref:Uncharacterized protein n=1 Tax=Gigaspora rosea TaxID=44941 RepID=A0A397VMH7_9GLOM|nr:hypothetical protein C2G38_2172332 [Gigaspora rosea]